MYGTGSAAGALAGAGTLAYTGAPLLGALVAIAGGLVIGGIVLFRFARRKHREQ